MPSGASRLLPALLLLAISLAACAPAPPRPKSAGHRDTVVLLSDPGEGAGVVIVEAGGVAQRLSKPLEATRISFGEAPDPPFLMDEPSLRVLAGEAMAALPEAPIRFILHFEKGSADLVPGDEAVFLEALEAIRSRGAVDVSVVGHSDTLGDNAYNDRLSLKRAVAVAARLEAKGILPSILEIASHGKANPLVPTADQVAEPRNRRVEVTVR